MTTELATHWVKRTPNNRRLDHINALLNGGWELVEWTPVAIPPPLRAEQLPHTVDRADQYDEFLLKKVESNSM